MKSLGRRPAGWDGHLLLLYHSESQRRDGVATWVRRGLELGEKILYTEPPNEPPCRSLPGLLADQADADEAFGRGQIQVVIADEAAYDPAWQANMVDEALAQGYPSVRWSGEATTAWALMPRDRHAGIERATDQLCRSTPLSVMCQYSAHESEVLLDACLVHGAGLRDPLFSASPFEGGVAVAGEIDVSNRDIVRSLLLAATSVTDRDPFVLDLSALDFLDLAGVRGLLLGTGPYRGRGRHVRFHGQPAHVDRLIHLLGVQHEPGVLTEEN